MNRKRILIVEDDAIIAMDLQFTAEDAGFEVIGPASTLEQGLALAHQGGLDMALLDMNLRNQNSYEIAQLLTSENVPVVFLSGSEGDDRPDDIKTLDVLAKPVDTNNLLAHLNSFLAPTQAVAS